MKKFCAVLFALAASACNTPVVANSYTYDVTGIYDGDTFYIEMNGLPPELKRIGVRVRGVDTPEIRGKCAMEKHNALAAKAFTTRSLASAGYRVTLSNVKWDKYGGRIDADVMVSGKSLAKMLIERGYARHYDGGKRNGWCS